MPPHSIFIFHIIVDQPLSGAMLPILSYSALSALGGRNAGQDLKQRHCHPRVRRTLRAYSNVAKGPR